VSTPKKPTPPTTLTDLAAPGAPKPPPAQPQGPAIALGELLAGLGVEVTGAAADAQIRSLSVDSRTVTPGALFAAFRGEKDDGARFAPAAEEKGAAAILCDRPLPTRTAASIVAADPRRVFAIAAARFHGEPSAQLKLLGVTGTNGKTTTTYLVEQLAAALGERAGLLGTVEQRWPGFSAKASHTTPESHDLQAALAQMAKARVEVAAIEVSSHALSQRRADGCRFAAAAFTNLTRDHLDYHRTLDAYFDAKARLFRTLLPAHAPAVLNLDDDRCNALAAELSSAGHKVIGFTTRGARPPRGASLLAAEGLVSSLSGLSFTLRAERASLHYGAPDAPAQRYPVQSPLIGAHNAENLLAAFGLLTGGAHAPLNLLTRLTASATGAPGRMERVPDPAGRVVLVDYAHTDDALSRVLEAVGEPARAAGARVLCVFGCGGDRDAGKRPLMGRAAGARSHLTVATSDNPRTEDPLAILAQVEAGLAETGGKKITREQAQAGEAGHLVIPDRRAAIEAALSCARRGDVVVIAGKGHEAVQIVGQEARPFDDRLEAAAALERLAASAEKAAP
jgi:UDP-N-acetylmuramoyl-L-alanyl-D-glutamate--2,6-diaminopimelate ligase